MEIATGNDAARRGRSLSSADSMMPSSLPRELFRHDRFLFRKDPGPSDPLACEGAGSASTVTVGRRNIFTCHFQITLDNR